MTEPAAALVIAIDGPSGSGKSSVSRAVARGLGLAYLDTGAMFRALTWWCLHEHVDLEDLDAVAEAARRLPLTMGTDPTAPSVQVGGVPVDEAIRLTEISSSVSRVATNLEVRAELLRRQRDIIADCSTAGSGVVAEGRDITTVVAPDADVRILLLASEEARLARRAKELHGAAARRGGRRDPRPDRPPGPRRLLGLAVHAGRTGRRHGGHLPPRPRAVGAGRARRRGRTHRTGPRLSRTGRDRAPTGPDEAPSKVRDNGR